MSRKPTERNHADIANLTCELTIAEVAKQQGLTRDQVNYSVRRAYGWRDVRKERSK